MGGTLTADFGVVGGDTLCDVRAFVNALATLESASVKVSLLAGLLTPPVIMGTFGGSHRVDCSVSS